MELTRQSRRLRGTIAAAAAGALCGTLFAGYELGSRLNADVSCPHPEPLEKAAFTTVPKPNYFGQVEVINNGPCVAVYDRESLKTVATIATGEAFAVTCADSKPNSFQVNLGKDTAGYVNYVNELQVTNSPGYDHPLIPGC